MANYKSLPDHELLQLLKESDHSAYNEVYRRYFHLVFRYAYKKLRDEEQAKDVIQEVFTNLWLKRESKSSVTNLGSYLYTAVRYKIFDLFARQETAAKYADSFNKFLRNHIYAPTDHLIREKQLQTYIEKEIETLPRKMKQIFIMSRRENLSYQEIAEKLNVSENNVSKQVNNALKLLRTKLGLLLYIYFITKL